MGVQLFPCYLDPPEEDFICQAFNVKSTQVRDTLEQINVTSGSQHTTFGLCDVLKGGLRGLPPRQEDCSGARRRGAPPGVHFVGCTSPVTPPRSALHHAHPQLRQPIRHGCQLGNPRTPGQRAFRPWRALCSGNEPSRNDGGPSARELPNYVGRLRVTKAPVVFSHLSAYSLRQHLRNVPDDVLVSIRLDDGLVRVNFYHRFLAHTDKREATMWASALTLTEWMP